LFSDEDIKKAVEQYNNNPEDGLLIEPFDRKYLSPVGYDLRVGKQGFSWNKKRIINIELDGKIQIEANDTVVIQTLESISLSKKVAATVHSVVSKIITKGLSDISTTIDPGWTGKLLISVHNYRDSSTELRFQEYFCTVCFYRVELESKINLNRSIDRDELWEQLLEKAEDERKRIEQAKNQKEIQIKNTNKIRKIQLIFFIFIALTGGIATSVINPTLGSSLAGFLAVIAPIVYDMLKPISK
jgi:dCTP deaminase